MNSLHLFLPLTLKMRFDPVCERAAIAAEHEYACFRE